MTNLFRKLQLSKRQAIFYSLLFLITLCNIIPTAQYSRKLIKIKDLIHINFDGYKFSGLNEVFGDTLFVGYYTDKDLKDTAALKQFSQAQYQLAPIVLDTTRTDHPFVIFDCSSQEVALKKINQLNLTPIKKNNFGIIIAKKL